MPCMYFPKEKDLTFKGREHVFPAGLGCKTKLPKGAVSDKANNLFSSLEDDFLNRSVIALPRMMYGPGKRGSLSIDKAAQSDVAISKNDFGNIELTYIALGKPYIISQFYRVNDECRISLRPPKVNESVEDVFSEFEHNLSGFQGRAVHLYFDEIAPTDCIVGFHEDKFYYATNREIATKDRLSDEIQIFLKMTDSLQFQTDKPEVHYLTSKVGQHHKIMESPKTARVYAKIALNTLAYLKGQKFVLQPCFDHIRAWVTEGAFQDEFLSLPQGDLEKIADYFPKLSHWCLFMKMKGDLYAIVCLYGSFLQVIKMTDLSEIPIQTPDGFVCDWMNQKDYKFSQYITQFIEQLKLETNNE